MEQVFDLAQKSFDVYKQRFESLLGLVLMNLAGFAVFVLLAIVFAVFAAIYQPGFFSNFQPDIIVILVGVLLGLIGLLFVFVISFWSQVATLYVVKEREAKIGAKQALKIAWPKLRSFVWISILTGLAVLAGFILFIIPGIIFAIWFGFSLYVFVSEDLKGTAALKRSKELVKGRWWSVFARFLLVFIAGLIITQLKFLGVLINIFFFAPYSTIFIFLFYEDLKSDASNQQFNQTQAG